MDEAGAVAGTAVAPDPRDLARRRRTERLRHGPVLPTLLLLALPNMAMAFVQSGAWAAEAALVGRFGTVALAGLALVYPAMMLMQMMSAGAMGGGVSSAVARALGAGDRRRADALACNALAIALAAGLLFTLLLLALGPLLFRALGGRDAVLASAVGYAGILYLAVLPVWLVNAAASVLRGSGDMRTPALVLVATAGLQVALALALGFGLGPVPAFGPAGIAAAYGLSFAAAAVVLLAVLLGGRAGIRLSLDAGQLGRALLWDILRVGAIACVSSVMTILTVLLLTGLAGRFGAAVLAAYGLSARLELLLIPVIFGVGAAGTAMVGTNVGAGDWARAHRAAWSAAAVAAGATGLVGLVAALAPDLWLGLFSDDPAVRDAGRLYLQQVGPAYWAFGLGLALYFASQGAGRMLWPTISGFVRLAVAAGGGWLATVAFDGGPAGLFAAIALGLLCYGALIAGPIALGAWRPRL